MFKLKILLKKITYQVLFISLFMFLSVFTYSNSLNFVFTEINKKNKLTLNYLKKINNYQNRIAWRDEDNSGSDGQFKPEDNDTRTRSDYRRERSRVRPRDFSRNSETERRSSAQSIWTCAKGSLVVIIILVIFIAIVLTIALMKRKK